MKYFLLIAISLLAYPIIANSQCTTTNATGCSCETVGSTDCDLLPDIKASEAPLLVQGSSGIIEYSQSGNGSNDGRLRISVSTPNIGHGPLEIHTSNIYICGTDTFIGTAPSICADGSNPKILINQRIYHKNGNTMSYYDRAAGSMTYHPSHGHMHVDDWGVFTLRKEDTTITDPLQWPIVGNGAKLAFCLMDYGTCSYYNGHCVDDNNTVMMNGDFPNWGLGGGNYNCSPLVQGISSGYTDIYYQSLDGMWIDIPPGTCNGDYYIVVQIDPLNFFLEENENNNIQVVPFTLTQQSSSASASITHTGPTVICQGGSITLNASLGNLYTWSDGSTTQSITVNTSGTYSVTVDSDCGIGTSDPVTINVVPVTDPVTNGDTLVNPGNAVLTANGTGSGGIHWYDDPIGGNLVGTGSVFNTPLINSNTTFYAEDVEISPGNSSFAPPNDSSFGGGAYHTSTQRYLIFDVHKAITLESVLVYSNATGMRDIELRDAFDNVLQTASVMVSSGSQRVNLNFNILPGTNYRLGIGNTTTPNFFRNNSGVNYPYSVNGVVDITGSSAGSSYYYFYYDWEVKESDLECSSNRVPAEVIVLNPTSINHIDFYNSIQVYPNPSNGFVNIEVNSENVRELEIDIIDITGKKVKQITNQSNVNSMFKTQVDITQLSSGLYNVVFRINNKVYTKTLSLE